MALFLVGLCLAAVITLYLKNNPLGHSRKFMLRRFINWFPLGMTYAFLYLSRYNLNISKNALGDLMTKEQFGIIFAAGPITYGLSFLLNGPIVDKIGGKKGIIIAALGS
jgi:OPA family glycerol-3-phosphate transporter-like MFS transporter